MNKRLKKKKLKAQKELRLKMIDISIQAAEEERKLFPITEAEKELTKKIYSRSPRKLMTVTQNLSDILTPEEIVKLKNPNGVYIGKSGEGMSTPNKKIVYNPFEAKKNTNALILGHTGKGRKTEKG